ncbi:MAG TPA: hypothetical protein VEB21_02460, partial [Terriglobales bacterium]|nr:hypothetical protein [Terriglobales bacterium]
MRFADIARHRTCGHCTVVGLESVGVDRRQRLVGIIGVVWITERSDLTDTCEQVVVDLRERHAGAERSDDEQRNRFDLIPPHFDRRIDPSIDLMQTAAARSIGSSKLRLPAVGSHQVMPTDEAGWALRSASCWIPTVAMPIRVRKSLARVVDSQREAAFRRIQKLSDIADPRSKPPWRPVSG